MKRAWWFPLALVVLLGGWLLASSPLEADRAPERGDAWPARPNVVLVVLDALRADHLAFYGYDRRTAPFLDDLAAGGAVFERAYAASTWTPSSVASLFTGLYPHDHNVRTGYAMTRRAQESELPLVLNRLPDEAATLAKLLRARGYETFGATSNPNFSEKMGFQRGFDRFDLLQDKAADALDASVRRFLAARAPGRPYFLYLHFMDTHKPYARREAFVEPGVRDSQHARYESEIGYVDAKLRELHAALGWSRDALVVVTADHGEEFRDHGGVAHRNTMYAELLRVPLVLSWPGVIEPRRVADNVSLVDLLPTLVALASGDAAGGAAVRHLPGTSLLPALRGAPLPERTLFAMRWTETRQPPLVRSAVIRGRWKYVRSLPGGREELYDTRTDPADEHDVLARHADVHRELRRALDELEAKPPRHERAFASSAESGRELSPKLRALGYVE